MSKLLELADAYADAFEIPSRRAALVAEIKRVERDAARLGWLDKYCRDHDYGDTFFLFEGEGKNIREAIDAAIAAEGGKI